MPVLNSMGAASFIAGTVNDDLELGADAEAPDSVAEEGIPGLKSTHQMEWTNVYIHAEPLAIILPIGEDVLEDSQYPIWDEIRPRIVEAFGIAIDNAVIWGQGRPTSWPSGIVPTAISRFQSLIGKLQTLLLKTNVFSKREFPSFAKVFSRNRWEMFYTISDCLMR